MNNSTARTGGYSFIDTWETLRQTVVERAPSVARELERRRHSDWERMAPRDRAALALAAVFDLNGQNAAVRRQMRGLLQDFERDALIEKPVGSIEFVREQPAVFYQDLRQKQREEAAADLNWILSPHFETALRGAAGPIAALSLVEKKSKLLKGLRACRFLISLGYPLAVPDKAKRRWMHRFGLLEEVKETKNNRSEALRVLGGLGREVGNSLPEMDLLLGVFTGSYIPEEPDAGYCLARPRCSACPVRERCKYATFLRTHGHFDKAAPEKPSNLASAFLPEDRPREKLARDGPGALSNAELLAILIRTGNGKKHAVEVASSILRDAGSLERLAGQSIKELTGKEGMGPVKAITVRAALELARRMSDRRKQDDPLISCARDVFELLRGWFLERKKEYFVCLLMNTKNRVFRWTIVSEGTLTQSLVHPREAFVDAVKDSASAVIFAHNHPSGDPAPSRDDRLLTRRLVKAGNIMGIRVLDHVIIGRETYYSFADEGELRED